MSVTVSRAEGVTMLTLTTDSQSPWPPLCQILKTLCYSPICCSVSQHLKSSQNSSLRVLGVIQIMVGLLNIGLGSILTCSRIGSWWQMDETGFPYWMGGFFIVFGIVCILSERYPSPCLLILNIFLHLVGVGFAIAAIVLYSINVAHIYTWQMCGDNDDYWYRHRTTPKIVTVEQQFLQDKCTEGKELVLGLLRGINAVLIILSVLELCVVLSCFVLGIKSLQSKDKGPNKMHEDADTIKPLLEDTSTTPTA